ncbi:hypothetical protein LO772_07965 [Yinghuangia sp. ASG 101]|uniref:hypothetical protein n=1 Tax=Yinghuangia sp. ASG 101 TaxID=2896848 RepID=UPI001E4BAF2C|nr:hypothetical protein [Yinghuangia sp. ASG 101]UGQ13529.1 hypothetical protein LO772_07965 [Yinghuangia sp. ASG 101]
MNTTVSRNLVVDGRGRLPLVRDCADPIALGVHPAASGHGAIDRVTPFVTRDVSDRLHTAVQSRDFVLLVGESTAGKTRAVYQALTAVLGDHVLVEPHSRADIAAAVEAACTSARPCVIWLDDLERYLGTGGLTRGDIHALVSGGRHRNTIVATIRAEEQARFLFAGNHYADRLGDDARRQGAEVIGLAHRIHLPRRWSTTELTRLREHTADPRIAEALEHADTFGVSEYLAAGPQLFSAWQDAWAPGTQPRGAALVAAGVLARRGGVHRHLTAHELADAADAYLEQRGGALLRPEPLTEAVAWATTPLFATSSLLLPNTHGALRAFDYLIDALPKDQPPSAAVAALVAVATLDEVIDLAGLANGWEMVDIAESAYRRVLADPAAARRPQAMSDLSYLIEARDGSAQALRFASDTVRECEARLGRDHPETLYAQSLEAWHMHHNGDSARALAIVESLLATFGSTPGVDEEFVLSLRRGVAQFNATLGNHAEAAQAWLDLARDWELRTGPDAHVVADGMVFHARHSGHAQGPGHAYANVQALFREPRVAPGTSAHRDVGHLLAYEAVEAGDFATAARLFRERAEMMEQEVGPTHSRVLHLRYELADCQGHLGDPGHAVRTLEEVIAAHEMPTAGDQRLGFRLHLRLATWIGRAGDPSRAARRLRQLADLCRSSRGAEDRMTLAIRSHAAGWTAESGDVAHALTESRGLLATCERVLGPSASLTTTVRERHDRWERGLHQAT